MKNSLSRRVAPVALAVSLAGFAGANAAPPPASPAAGVLAASPTAEMKLGNAPVRVEVPLSAEEEKRLEETLARGGRLRLAIEGLQLLHPGAVYEVYLNLPTDQKPAPDSPYRIGNLSLFAAAEAQGEVTRTFDVTDRLKALRQRGQWADRLELTFVRQDRSGKTLAGPGEAGAFLRFTRVAILSR